MKSLLRMSQSAMSRAIHCILISINYSYMFNSQNELKIPRIQKLCYARYEKSLKNHFLDVQSPAAAQDPEERAFYN